jgi:coproporphyrinogen III oxidase-like Fe-S oxidoreductase
MDGILAKAEICEEHEFSFEAHPNNTTREHLQTFYDLGFRRNSFGVQDYDPKVQMSSISDSWYAFAQNVKTVDEYTNLLNAGKILIFRGHELSNEDLVIRKHILNIMCHFETSWTDEAMQFPELQECLER